MQQTEPDIRIFLIDATIRFIGRAKAMSGVRKISLVGSLTKDKTDPKDVDIIVTIEDTADLTDLANAARKLKGVAQTRNKGADIFLANPDGRYIGRICHWRECGPGIRTSCDALNCGARHFLHDDFDDITLDSMLVKEPPIEVWPALVCRGAVPNDLMTTLSRFQSGIGAT